MRLLQLGDDGSFRLTKFAENEIPPYAILSHVWGLDGAEVTYEEILDGRRNDKADYDKLYFCATQAKKDRLQYFWVDTCCINKADAIELQTAINSMFRWYQRAARCYVYLSDVSTRKRSRSTEPAWEGAFRLSRWFTRGWTLQELLAPRIVEFFSRDRKRLGDKVSLELQIQEITGIQVEALRGGLSNFSFHERRLWSINRKTTFEEDQVYCLVGIFGVYMLPNYGESREYAFLRLKDEIERRSSDMQVKRSEHQAIAEWISHTDFPAQQSDLIGKREEGTGQWFLDSPEFANWLRGPRSTLFCPGMPGAGKTMLAAIAIDHLLKTTISDEASVTYIYCNYKTQTNVTASTLLGALLKQLVCLRPIVDESVVNLYEQHVNRRTKPVFQEINTVLQAVLKNFSTVYVVIDALDECSNRDGTRNLFFSALFDTQRDADLRLMFTSRFIPDVEVKFKLTPTLEIRASDADVKRFVRGQIHRLPNCIRRDHQLQTVVEIKINKAIDGMFLLARLHVDSLLDKRTKAKVLATLERLSISSSSLEKAYDDVLKRIEAQLPDDTTLAKTVLSWIIYAQRPLTVGELCHALAVDQGDEQLQVDNVPDIEDIVSVCAGLVTVDVESNVIRLVHHTTQEYFEQIRDSWNPTAQQQIASTCLTYLSFRNFSDGSCSSDIDFEARLAQYPLYDYAAQYWSNHAKDVQEQVSEVAYRFLHDESFLSSATQAMSASQYRYSGSKEWLRLLPGLSLSQRFPRHTTGLHLMAKLDLLILLRLWLLSSENISRVNPNAKDSDGRAPLSFAAEFGREAVVRQLLDTGVEVDSHDSAGQTALLWAARNGHEAVVKLLLDHNAYIDYHDNGGLTPLAWAAKKGQEDTTRLLVEMGAGLEKKDKEDLTPLSLAVNCCQEAVVKLLIKMGADIETKNKNNRTPLSLAAALDQYAVVKLLVERGAELENKDTLGWTPLLYTCVFVGEAVRNLLLDKGANLEVRDINGRTPLSWAAHQGDEAMVKMLLEKGADPNSNDIDGMTPLSRAAETGEDVVVTILLAHEGVSLNCEDIGGLTPLSWAAMEGNESVLKILLANDSVELDSKDNRGQSPLSLAAEKGHKTVVELLVERNDVEADSKDNDHRTPLSYAAEEGHSAVVRLLVGRDDVDTDSKDDDGRTPLWYAAARGHEAVVKLLVERRTERAK